VANYIISRKALDDLSDIWKYSLEVWSEKQADRYYNEILQAFEAVSINPSIGKKYLQLDVLIKGYKVNRHIIFYSLDKENTLFIVRILHEKMDTKSHIATEVNRE
jgi:toxin ParE1/3/4